MEEPIGNYKTPLRAELRGASIILRIQTSDYIRCWSAHHRIPTNYVLQKRYYAIR